MNSEPMPRSTWIILGAAMLILVILTGVFVSGIFSANPVGPSNLRQLAGIRYEPDRSKPTIPVAACNLLTPDQVTDVIGKDVGPGVQSVSDNPLGESICTFSDPGDPEKMLARLNIVYAEGMASFLIANDYSVQQLFEGRNIGGGQTRQIEAVGDAAFWGGSGTEIWNGLHIQIWDVYMDVDVFTVEDEVALQQAKALGGLVLGALFPVE